MFVSTRSTHRSNIVKTFSVQETRCWDRVGVGIFCSSGMLSCIMFIVAEVIYTVAVFVCGWGDPTVCSWLYFWAALIFVAESFVDLYFLQKFQVDPGSVCAAPEDDDHEVGTDAFGDHEDSVLDESTDESTDESKDDDNGGLHERSSIDRFFLAVNWELWASIFFLIPSVIYLLATLVDPNVVGARFVAALTHSGVDVAGFTTACNWSAGVLFVFDGCLRICAWWACLLLEPAPQRWLIVFRCWRATRLDAVDWILWANALFVLAALLQVLAIVVDFGVPWSAALSALWLVDALVYLVGNVPTWISMLEGAR